MKKWGFLLFPILALAVGGLAGFLSRKGLETVYPLLEKSPLTPPGAVFPVVWSVLYILMGIGLALVVYKGGENVPQAAVLWALQLALNFSWSLLFFAGGYYLAALLCLVVLWVAILAMIAAFAVTSRPAAWAPRGRRSRARQAPHSTFVNALTLDMDFLSAHTLFPPRRTSLLA